MMLHSILRYQPPERGIKLNKWISAIWIQVNDVCRRSQRITIATESTPKLRFEKIGIRVIDDQTDRPPFINKFFFILEIA